jgi:hypothetical protein
MADLQKLVDELSGLTVLEAAGFRNAPGKWGVSAAARCRGAARLRRGCGRTGRVDRVQ